MSNAKNSRLQDLLEKAKQRQAQKQTTPQSFVKQEPTTLYDNSPGLTTEVIKLDNSVPKQKDYKELVEDFNDLFEETKTNIEEHKEPVKKITPTPVVPVAQPYIKEKPKTITKTTTKPIVNATEVKTTPQVKVETQNSVSQSLVKTETTTESKVTLIEEEDHAEETELEEDEFLQEDVNEFEDEDGEEDELDEDEGLDLHDAEVEKEKNEIKILEKIKNIKPASPKDRTARDATYLDLIRKSLKSLEEDAWNEVKFNMSESIEYFDKQRTLATPEEIDKFYRITLAFLRFAEGGLELDQGDFADFEDAEAHYLDSQDILDAVELKLNSKDAIDQELLKIIQTVKKYINEDIEYIEEMIDLS